LREVARRLGLTQERTRKLEAEALRRLAADDSLAAWRDAA
jgi:DNA-directed RNA polymerase sigma subunit (sigma70/sigma32)